ncbi:hypothetical protein [Atlantibacter sp.]|uniref:hypothetical protein n=1 Tax=Atlantibacter sp. TaxID=1903473 RepID=UPI0028A68C6C|nr:hypothetical protein [Atlantibacter sp.]
MAVQKNNSRNLTPGEIALAKSIFKASINYSLVRVHKGSYFPFNLQDENTAVTPNGEIYFMPRYYSADHSHDSPEMQHWFIHEMTHVWQYQLGLNVRLRGSVSWAVSYHYSLPNYKIFSDYSMEEQASIVADYFFLIKHGQGGFSRVANLQGIKGPDLLKRYEWTMRRFLIDPAYRGNLP